MRRPLVCPNGHHWVQEQADLPTALGLPPPVCPVCGCDGTSCPEDPAHEYTISTVDALSESFSEPGKERPPALPASELPVFPGYEVLSELGRGGMGVVYKVYDRAHKQVVALKTLQWVDPSSLYRFKQEFRALADVTHPNLIGLHELIADERLWFFTMEFIDGESFLAHVRPRVADPGASTVDYASGPASPPEAGEPLTSVVDVASGPRLGAGGHTSSLQPAQVERLRRALLQLAAGILALHEAGRLHRDLKPGNVLVTRQERVVILDFGLAAELDRTGQHERLPEGTLGTAHYMAPEQAAGRPLSPASDWYSFGVMLYQALTGRLPFPGPRLQVLHDKQRFDPPAPHELVAEVPDDLEALCLELLRRDPAARPSGRAVLQRLGATPAAVPRPTTRLGAQLVGRERHLAALEDAFAATRRWRTVVQCVHGRSGAGKSALVQWFLDRLGRRPEVVILAGRCYEQESVPYKALDSVVDSLSRYLKRLPHADVEALLPEDVGPLLRVFAVLQQVPAVREARGRPVTPDPQELRRRAFAGLRQLLSRLGSRRPLVLFIDDLQWGDADSAALLADLLHPPEPPLLLLVGSYRSEQAASSPFLRVFLPELERMASALDHRELAVESLTEAEAGTLALALLGRDDPATRARAEALARESLGNPLFLYELVQHVQAGEEIAREGQATAPVTLDDALWARVCALPDAARRLLEVVAVAGQPVRKAEACRAVTLETDQWGAVAALHSGRLVRSTGLGEADEFETYHDRIRETVVAHLSLATLTAHHRALAEVLEASGQADPEELAVHFQGAGEAARAAPYYALAAAQAAEALAFDRAAKLYRLSLQMKPAEGAAGRRLQMQLGDALANAGRGLEAACQYQAAAVGAGPVEALELQRRAAYQYCISGHLDEGRAALRAVLAGVGLKLPATPLRSLLSLLRSRFLLWLRGLSFRPRQASAIPEANLRRIDVSWSASAGLSMINIVAGADFQTRNLLLALRAGESYRIARALAWEAAHTSNAGGPSWPRTTRLLEAAQGLAQHLGNPHALGMATLASGIAEFTRGRFPASLALLEQAASTFRDRCTGVAWEVDTAQAFLLWALVYVGDFAALARRSSALLKEARERGDLYAATTIGTFVEPHVRLAADDPAGARQLVREFLGQWSREGFHLQHLTALMSDTYIDLYEGNGRSAWERLQGQWPAVVGSHFLRVQILRIFLFHLRARSALAAAAASDDARLLPMAEKDARRIEREKMTWSVPLAQLLRAGLAMRRGHAETAQAQLAAASAGFETVGLKSYAAAAQRRLGRLRQGADGTALVAAADAWMASQDIRNAGRMTAMHAPGFPD
jgi:serine/threonine protein kinase